MLDLFSRHPIQRVPYPGHRLFLIPARHGPTAEPTVDMVILRLTVVARDDRQWISKESSPRIYESNAMLATAALLGSYKLDVSRPQRSGVGG